MRYLYLFPHPDDESFGPGPAIARQRRQGHEVWLLTLTRGGATKERHRLGYTVEQMGEVRYREMLDVARALDLADLTVLDLPDSGLKELDPRAIEAVVREHLLRVRPDVVVTYPVHGISGFHDHLVTHAVVKRVFCELRDERPGGWAPRRLAFFTLEPADRPEGPHRLSTSTPDEIDCRVAIDEQDLAAGRAALDCYVTYQTMIEAAKPLAHLNGAVAFEIFGERWDPPLEDLSEGLGDGGWGLGEVTEP